MHHLQKEEAYQRAYLERILGVTWDRDTLRDMVSGQQSGKSGSGGDGPVFVPLTLLLRPELIKDLSSYATPNLGPDAPRGTISLYDEASKDVFLKMLSGIGIGG